MTKIIIFIGSLVSGVIFSFCNTMGTEYAKNIFSSKYIESKVEDSNTELLEVENNNTELLEVEDNDTELLEVEEDLEVLYITEEEFIKENEYTIYAGKFNTPSSLQKRLTEVQSAYGFAQSTKTTGRIILEHKYGLSAEDIYTKSLAYHYGLLDVISDELKENEKWAVPEISNSYLDKELANIEKYASQQEYDKCEKSIEVLINIIDYYNTDYDGYIAYRNAMKKIIDNYDVLKIRVNDIYHRL